MATDPRWSFTGQQVVDALRAEHQANEEWMAGVRASWAEEEREQQAKLDEWERTSPRKRGERPSLYGHGDSMLSLHRIYTEERGRIAKAAGAFAIEPDRVFELDVDDVNRYGLAVKGVFADAPEAG
jgi:hypothetical protein